MTLRRDSYTHQDLKRLLERALPLVSAYPAGSDKVAEIVAGVLTEMGDAMRWLEDGPDGEAKEALRDLFETFVNPNRVKMLKRGIGTNTEEGRAVLRAMKVLDATPSATHGGPT